MSRGTASRSASRSACQDDDASSNSSFRSNRRSTLQPRGGPAGSLVRLPFCGLVCLRASSGGSSVRRSAIGRPTASALIALSPCSDGRRVRVRWADATRFLVAPSAEHVAPTVEHVATRHERCWIVEKVGRASGASEALDSRGRDGASVDEGTDERNPCEPARAGDAHAHRALRIKTGGGAPSAPCDGPDRCTPLPLVPRAFPRYWSYPRRG
jgi:hypothetical protein